MNQVAPTIKRVTRSRLYRFVKTAISLVLMVGLLAAIAASL